MSCLTQTNTGTADYNHEMDAPIQVPTLRAQKFEHLHENEKSRLKRSASLPTSLPSYLLKISSSLFSFLVSVPFGAISMGLLSDYISIAAFPVGIIIALLAHRGILRIFLPFERYFLRKQFLRVSESLLLDREEAEVLFAGYLNEKLQMGTSEKRPIRQ